MAGTPRDNTYDRQYGDDTDPELLALKPPPPSTAEAVFIVIIIGLSIAVLWWFLPEARYFAKAFSEPRDLGEAADVTTDALRPDDYVRVEGVPIINQTMVFRTGTKWFSGDVYRKLAPLSGNPDLFAQWPTNDPSIPQAQTAVTAPNVFVGRAVPQQSLSKNYGKFWSFYDCLRSHPAHLCKVCIGKPSYASCRPVVACMQRYPLEVCDFVAFQSRDEVRALRDETDPRLHPKRHALLRRAVAAFDDVPLWERTDRLDEAVDALRAAFGASLGEKDAPARRTARRIRRLRTQALDALLTDVRSYLNRLGSKGTDRLRQTQARIARLDEELRRLDARIRALRPLYQLTRVLKAQLALCTEITETLDALGWPQDLTDAWPIADPDKITGAKLHEKLLAYDAQVLQAKARHAQHAAEASPGDTDGQTDTNADGSPTDTDSAKDPQSPSAQRVRAALAAIRQRISRVGRAIDALAPDDAPDLVAWAGENDIVGDFPDHIREERVMRAFDNLEQRVARLSGEQTETVAARLSALQRRRKAAQRERDTLEATSGLAQWRAVHERNQIDAERDDVAAVRRLRALQRRLTADGIVPPDLTEVPAIRRALQRALPERAVSAVERRVSELTAASTQRWIIMSGERPGDNLWVLFVYTLVPLMLVLNVRRLLRYVAWWRTR